MLKDIKIFGRDVNIYINGEWYADTEIGKYLLDESEFELDVAEMVMEYVQDYGEVVSLEFHSVVDYEGSQYFVIFDEMGNVKEYHKIL